MRKSIYFKLVIAFIFTIIIGIFLSFELNYNLYFDKIYDNLSNKLLTTAKDVEVLYKDQSEENFDDILNTSVFSPYNINIYKNGKLIKVYGENLKVTKESIKTLDEGKIYINQIKPSKFPIKNMPTVGYPFEFKNDSYYVYITINLVEHFFDVSIPIKINFIIIIFTGVVMFSVLAKTIVSRIKILTIASKEVESGNFEMKIEAKGKDEISKLTKNFNSMVKKIRKTEQMRQEFVANVSHEIQSPITSIMGFSTLLQSDYLDDEDKKSYAKIIEEESRRLSKLSENLLKLTTLDNEQNIIKKSNFYLDEQIRKVILMMENQWAKKNINFNINLPKTKIYADKDLLEQVWINLINNAIKFSYENKSIDINIENVENKINVSIRDYGSGISYDKIEKIFDRFYQADESRKIEGSGLGLSIVKKIVDIHNGSILVNSRIDEGTQFIVVI
ncbi:HAMP domain-containing sensor histidine kinase [Paraclostridium bifermentans]|uniref:HAMP domain-containing sensor histidine kinase n=1 Tax=Paraclostridium bifermentans TaxID=1490 RepID=UPI00359C64B3